MEPLTDPIQMDNELFLNYEKNILLATAEKEYLSLHLKEGKTEELFCQHRHHYGKYTFQDKEENQKDILLEDIQRIEKT